MPKLINQIFVIFLFFVFLGFSGCQSEEVENKNVQLNECQKKLSESQLNECQRELSASQSIRDSYYNKIDEIDYLLKINPCPDKAREETALSQCLEKLSNEEDFQQSFVLSSLLVNEELTECKEYLFKIKLPEDLSIDECQAQLSEMNDSHARLKNRFENMAFMQKINKSYCGDEFQERSAKFLSACEISLKKLIDSSEVVKNEKRLADLKQQLQECKNQIEAKKVYFSKGGIEYAKYENKTYGYTIDVPRNWVAIWDWPSSPYLVDEMQEIGPWKEQKIEEDSNQNITIEVFNEENTTDRAFEEYDSLIDFYQYFRLENYKYTTDELLNEILTAEKGYPVKEIIKFEPSGEYLQTCRLMEKAKRLYVFCYNKDNHIHQSIIDSIKLK